MSYHTPLSNVEGLGSAHSGVEHFWRQRVTAAALIPLTAWFVNAMLGFVGTGRDAVIAYLHEPLHAVLMILFVLATLLHMTLGIETILEDYIPKQGQRIALMLLNKAFTWCVGAACLYAMFKIAI